MIKSEYTAEKSKNIFEIYLLIVYNRNKDIFYKFKGKVPISKGENKYG